MVFCSQEGRPLFTSLTSSLMGMDGGTSGRLLSNSCTSQVMRSSSDQVL